MKLNELFPLFFNSHRLRVYHGNSCILLPAKSLSEITSQEDCLCLPAGF
jgi:hypothetical protein